MLNIKYLFLLFGMFLCVCLRIEGATQYHHVKQGENLSSIARRYGTTVYEIKRLNNLNSSLIMPKQKLVVKITNDTQQSVKTSAVIGGYETISHFVKKGDNLEKISKRYGVSVASIKKTNNLNGSIIKIGQTLKISVPKKESPIPELVTPQPIVGIYTEKAYYKIKKGDTLESVASQYNITSEQLKEANLMLDSDFKEGLTIVIPAGYTIEDIGSLVSDDGVDTEIAKEAKTFREKILTESFNFLNMPYKLGGSGKTSIDCSTLVRCVYEKIGIKLPNTSYKQYAEGQPISKEEIEEGDLLFFYNKGSVGHVGIYIGDNMFIHASSNEKKVTIASLENAYFKRNYAGARRILPSKSFFVKGEDIVNK
ncbi:MAG: LysM peptidoglycan-binding domain-containing protein [Candidatus Ratteibacteria bacterium]